MFLETKSGMLVIPAMSEGQSSESYEIVVAPTFVELSWSKPSVLTKWFKVSVDLHAHSLEVYVMAGDPFAQSIRTNSIVEVALDIASSPVRVVAIKAYARWWDCVPSLPDDFT